MPSNSFDFAKSLRAHLVNSVWRQWAAIGGSAVTTTPAPGIVDPEALIFLTLYLAEDEPRLTDVLASWVRINSSLLSIQRLRNLRPSYPQAVSVRLSELALIGAKEAKDARWSSLTMEESPGTLIERGNKPRAVEVYFRTTAAAMLQFRCGMGVGIKADALTFLCGTWNQGQGWASPMIVSSATSYTPAGVRRALDDLARAKFVSELPTIEPARKGQQMYTARAPQWKALLELDSGALSWRYWQEVGRLATDICEWAASGAQRHISEYAADAGARRIVELHKTTILRNAFATPESLATSDLDQAFLRQLTQRLITWLDP